MRLKIGNDPNTEKETRLLRECFLDVIELEMEGRSVLCLVFEELDHRTILGMTTNLDKLYRLRALVKLLAEMRDTDETKESTNS